MTKLSEIIGEEKNSSKLKLSDIQEETSQPSVSDNIRGLGAGAALLGGIGYGLYKSRIPQSAISGFSKFGAGIANLPKVANYNKGNAFANEIRQEFIKAHTNKVNEFGGMLDDLAAKNPTKMVSLQSVVEELDANWNELPSEVKSIVKKTPYLKDMVKAKSPKSSKITLKQSQEIINYINTKVPKNIRANNLDVVDTVNNIKGSQLEAFPEMENVREAYKKFIEPYNQVKGQFKFNKLLTAIKNKFGGAEGQAAVDKILPKEVLKKMSGYRGAAKIAELPQDIPLIGRTLKSLGGISAIAPMVLQAISAIKQNPGNQMGQFFQMATGENPEESYRRWRESQTL